MGILLVVSDPIFSGHTCSAWALRFLKVELADVFKVHPYEAYRAPKIEFGNTHNVGAYCDD
jgi:hypothetical protein